MNKILISALALVVNSLSFAQDFAFTKDMQKREGFQTLYFDAKNDKVYLELASNFLSNIRHHFLELEF